MLHEQTKKKLRDLQEHLRKNPQRFNMETWLESLEEFREDNDVEKLEPPACNTVACLGGEYLIMTQQAKFSTYENCYIFDDSVEDAARMSLGLNFEQAAQLFKFKSWRHHYVSTLDGYRGWPAELEQEYYAAKTHAARVDAAIRRIDVFIESDGEI